MELSQNISILEFITNNPNPEFSVALYQAYNDEMKSIDAKIEEYSNDLNYLVTMMMDFLKKQVDTGIDKILFLKGIDEIKNMLITKLNELVFRKTVLELFKPHAVRQSKPGEIEVIEGGGLLPELLAAALMSAMIIPGVAGWSLFSSKESEEDKQEIIDDIIKKVAEYYEGVELGALKMSDEEYIKYAQGLKKSSIDTLKKELLKYNNLIEQKNKYIIIDKIIDKENEKLKLKSEPEMSDDVKELKRTELLKKKHDELKEYIEDQEIEIGEIEEANLKQGLINSIVNYYKSTSLDGLTPADEEILRQVLIKNNSSELQEKISELKKIEEKKILPHTQEKDYISSNEVTAYRQSNIPFGEVNVRDYNLNNTSFEEAVKNMSSASLYFGNLVASASQRREDNLLSQQFRNKNNYDDKTFIGYGSEVEVWFIDYVSLAHQDTIDYLNNAASLASEQDKLFPYQATQQQIKMVSEQKINVKDANYSYPVVMVEGINEGIANELSTIYQNRASRTINDLTSGTRNVIKDINGRVSEILSSVIESIAESIITLNSACNIQTSLDSNRPQECRGYDDAFRELSPSYFNLYMEDVQQHLRPIMEEENISELDIVTGDVETDITNIRKKNDYSVVSKNIQLVKNDVRTLFGEKAKNILEITDKSTIREFLIKNTPSFYFETMSDGNMFIKLNIQTNILNLKFLADSLSHYSHQKYIALYRANEEAIESCKSSKPGFLMSLFKSSDTTACSLSVETQKELQKLLNDKLNIDKFKNIILEVSRIKESLKNNLNIHEHLTDLLQVIESIGSTQLTQEQLDILTQMKQSSLFEESTSDINSESQQRRNKKRTDDLASYSNLLKAQRDISVEEYLTNSLNIPGVRQLTIPALVGYKGYKYAQEGLGFTGTDGFMQPKVFNWGALITVIVSSLYLVKKGVQFAKALNPITLANSFFSYFFSSIQSISVNIIDKTSATANTIWNNKGEVFYYSLSTAAASGVWYALYCMMYETFIQEYLPSNEIIKGLYFMVSVSSGVIIKLVLSNGYTICMDIDIKTMGVRMFGKPVDKSTLYTLDKESWIHPINKQEFKITRDANTNNILPINTSVSKTFIVQLNKNNGVIVSDTTNSQFIRFPSEEEFYTIVVPDNENPNTYIVEGDKTWPILTGLSREELSFGDNKWFETTHYFINFPRRCLITKLFQKYNIVGRIKGGKNNIGKKTRRRKNKKIRNKTKKIHKKRNLKTKNNKRNKKNKKTKARNKSKK